MTLAAAFLPLLERKNRSSFGRAGLAPRPEQDLAQALLVPLPVAEVRLGHAAHLPVARLFVRASAPAIAQDDPVVDAAQSQLVPRECRPQSDGFGRDAAAVEV